MMQQSVRFAPSPDCHHQRVGDELCRHDGLHRPHGPGAIGPVARKKTSTDLRAEILVALDASAAWPCQPAIKPPSRDTERLAQPFRRPDPPVLRNETELHVDSFAK